MHRAADLAVLSGSGRRSRGACAGMDRAPALGFGRFIISATSPLVPVDMQAVRSDVPGCFSGLSQSVGPRSGLQGLPWWRSRRNAPPISTIRKEDVPHGLLTNM